MSVNDQARADASVDAYKDRPQSDIRRRAEVTLNGQKYHLFGYMKDVPTGFHATAYQNTATNDVIIAYRGTDPDFRHHPRTAVLDVIADYVMVRDQVNAEAGRGYIRQSNAGRGGGTAFKKPPCSCQEIGASLQNLSHQSGWHVVIVHVT